MAAAIALTAGCGGSEPPPSQPTTATPASRAVRVGTMAPPFEPTTAEPVDGGESAASTTEPADMDAKHRKSTPLGAARVPFGNYINSMHERIHPLFTGSFLAPLDNRPASDPINNPALHAATEIVLDTEGRIVSLEVYESSGVAAFDAGVLKALRSAAPFGKPPPEIVSRDGKVYLHWECWRNPYRACSTYFTHPFYYPPATR